MSLVVKAALILALGAAPLGPPTHIGFAVRYDPGVMERRAVAHDAPPASCYVAYTLAHDDDMARLWVRVQGPAGTLDCLVVDLPDRAKGDDKRLIARRVWVELGFPSRWICGKGWSGRARDCPVLIWVIPGRVRRSSASASRSSPGRWLRAKQPVQRRWSTRGIWSSSCGQSSG